MQLLNKLTYEKPEPFRDAMMFEVPPHLLDQERRNLS